MQKQKVVRNTLKGIGLAGVILFLLGIPRSYLVLSISVAALFLGVTDFGRQCPLFLSAKHLVYRLRSKQRPPII